MDKIDNTLVSVETYSIELAPGTLLQNGRYRIVESIGQGGFGITYLAEQVMAGRKVCIKEYFPSEYYNRDANTNRITIASQNNAETMDKYKDKFLKEARVLASISHPHIIPVYDVFEENNTVYYAMEYIAGESLSDKVRRGGALREDDAQCFIGNIASALGYLHDKHTTHLDVKPSNIMVRHDDNRAILIDFGLAKHYDEAGRQTTSTPGGVSHGYAPMEMYDNSGTKTFSPETDIYSLGATLYYLVVGTVPPKASEVLNEGIGTLPSTLSNGTRNAIEFAMRPASNHRPHNIGEFMRIMGVTKYEPETKATATHKYLYMLLSFSIGAIVGLFGPTFISDLIEYDDKANAIVVEEVDAKTTETFCDANQSTTTTPAETPSCEDCSAACEVSNEEGAVQKCEDVVCEVEDAVCEVEDAAESIAQVESNKEIAVVTEATTKE